VGPRASMYTQERRALKCNFVFYKRQGVSLQLSGRHKYRKVNYIRLNL